jgi:hypothetical protein
LRRSSGTRILIDICDNHFYYTDDPTGRFQARASELRKAIAQADLVITASEALADVVGTECPGSRPAFVIPDAVEQPFCPSWVRHVLNPRPWLRLRHLQQCLNQMDIPQTRRLLWFGNHGSMGVEGGMTDLARMREFMETAARIAPLSLTVLSNNAVKYAELTRTWSIPKFYLDWNLTTFSRAAQLHSTALIPITKNPFTVCKTNNRISTAILHNLNVIGTTIPSYAEFSECAMLDDWQTGFGTYLDDAERRLDHLQRGQAIIHEHYTIEKICHRWLTAFDQLIS